MSAVSTKQERVTDILTHYLDKFYYSVSCTVRTTSYTIVAIAVVATVYASLSLCWLVLSQNSGHGGVGVWLFPPCFCSVRLLSSRSCFPSLYLSPLHSLISVRQPYFLEKSGCNVCPVRLSILRNTSAQGDLSLFSRSLLGCFVSFKLGSFSFGCSVSPLRGRFSLMLWSRYITRRSAIDTVHAATLCIFCRTSLNTPPCPGFSGVDDPEQRT
jgi:hypothetical protein